jgi:hypothetical protein
MAQSMVTIYKLLGPQSVRRYDAEGKGPVPLLRLLESEEVGPRLLFKTSHFDPTSIAIIDVLQHQFPRLAAGQGVTRFKDEDFDVLTVVLPAGNLLDAVAGVRYDESNIEELNLLYSLVRAAVSFCSELLIEEAIDSVLVITVETLGPSLLDEDIVMAAHG